MLTIIHFVFNIRRFIVGIGFFGFSFFTYDPWPHNACIYGWPYIFHSSSPHSSFLTCSVLFPLRFPHAHKYSQWSTSSLGLWIVVPIPATNTHAYSVGTKGKESLKLHLFSSETNLVVIISFPNCNLLALRIPLIHCTIVYSLYFHAQITVTVLFCICSHGQDFIPSDNYKNVLFPRRTLCSNHTSRSSAPIRMNIIRKNHTPHPFEWISFISYPLAHSSQRLTLMRSSVLSFMAFCLIRIAAHLALKNYFLPP